MPPPTTNPPPPAERPTSRSPPSGTNDTPTSTPSSPTPPAGSGAAPSRKRPPESSDDEPAAKRARKTSPDATTGIAVAAASAGATAIADTAPVKPRKKTPLIHEALRNAWDALRGQYPGRFDFHAKELQKQAEADWDRLRPDDRRGPGWGRRCARAINQKSLFARVGKNAFRLVTQEPDNGRRDRPPSPLQDARLPPDELQCRPAVPPAWTAPARPPVRLSSFDKSGGISFVGDPAENIVRGNKGYRMVRATSGVCEGDWFFEVTVREYEGDGAVRLGWSMRRSDVETPVGFDAHSFGIRDRTGEFIHKARLKPYGMPFGIGDVIGCRIALPHLTDEEKDRVMNAEKSFLYFRFVQQMQGVMVQPGDDTMNLMPHARVEYYKNGVHMGVPEFFQRKEGTGGSADKAADEGAAQEQPGKNMKTSADKEGTPQQKERDASQQIPPREMRAGVYYPSVSLYGNAIAQANFGPDFRYPLPEGSRPMCEAATEPEEEKPPEADADVPAKEADDLPASSPVIAPAETNEKDAGPGDTVKQVV